MIFEKVLMANFFIKHYKHFLRLKSQLSLSILLFFLGGLYASELQIQIKQEQEHLALLYYLVYKNKIYIIYYLVLNLKYLLSNQPEITIIVPLILMGNMYRITIFWYRIALC